jgi:hypothetical protein
MNRLRTTRVAAVLGATVLVLAAAGHAQGPRSPRALPGNTYLDGPATKPELKKISEHLWVYTGPINVGVVRDGEKALLVDCGDGAVAGVLVELGVKTVDRITVSESSSALLLWLFT